MAPHPSPRWAWPATALGLVLTIAAVALYVARTWYGPLLAAQFPGLAGLLWAPPVLLLVGGTALFAHGWHARRPGTGPEASGHGS